MRKVFIGLSGVVMLIILMSNIDISQGDQKDGDQIMHLHLSEYGIFIGPLSDLHPTENFHLYELSSPLFSDYAIKQRLIKLPKGTRLKAIDDYLPEFPKGTVLVKSFYFPLNRKDLTKGRRIIETRLLIKGEGGWVAGTYIWNQEQTDATLSENREKAKVRWIDENGNSKAIHYKIPSKKDCLSCHQQNNSLLPIGFKIRNLNKEVQRSGKKINQLAYLHSQKLLSDLNPSNFTKLPDYTDVTENLTNRARAYLEINCAHCHNDSGSCSNSVLKFAYENTLDQTHIKDNKGLIKNLMAIGVMPKLGTSTVDKEGLLLIKEYLKKQK